MKRATTKDNIIAAIVYIGITVAIVGIALGIDYGEYLLVQNHLPDGMGFWEFIVFKQILRR